MPETVVPIELTVTPTKVTVNVPGNTVIHNGDNQTVKWRVTGGKFVATDPIDFGGKSPKKTSGKAENPLRSSDTECSFTYNNRNPKDTFTRFKYTVSIERDGVIYEIDPEMTNEPPMP